MKKQNFLQKYFQLKKNEGKNQSKVVSPITPLSQKSKSKSSKMANLVDKLLATKKLTGKFELEASSNKSDPKGENSRFLKFKIPKLRKSLSRSQNHMDHIGLSSNGAVSNSDNLLLQPPPPLSPNANQNMNNNTPSPYFNFLDFENKFKKQNTIDIYDYSNYLTGEFKHSCSSSIPSDELDIYKIRQKKYEKNLKRMKKRVTHEFHCSDQFLRWNQQQNLSKHISSSGKFCTEENSSAIQNQYSILNSDSSGSTSTLMSTSSSEFSDLFSDDSVVHEKFCTSVKISRNHHRKYQSIENYGEYQMDNDEQNFSSNKLNSGLSDATDPKSKMILQDSRKSNTSKKFHVCENDIDYIIQWWDP